MSPDSPPGWTLVESLKYPPVQNGGNLLTGVFELVGVLDRMLGLAYKVEGSSPAYPSISEIESCSHDEQIGCALKSVWILGLIKAVYRVGRAISIHKVSLDLHIPVACQIDSRGQCPVEDVIVRRIAGAGKGLYAEIMSLVPVGIVA